MSFFKGVRTKKGVEVIYKDEPLELKNELKIDTDVNYDWGNDSIGARQLSLAILYKLVSPESALENYQIFTKKFIKPIRKHEWEIDEITLREWLLRRNIICKLPPITNRFELKEYNKSYGVYLDGKKIGSHIEFPDRCNAITINEASCIYVYCDFSEVSHLKIRELPKNLVFDFVNSTDSLDMEADITEYLTLSKLHKVDNKTIVDFYFSIQSDEYFEDDINAVIAKDNLISSLYRLEGIKIERDFFQEGYHWIFVSLTTEEKNLKLKEWVYGKVDEMISIYKKNKSMVSNESFEYMFKISDRYEKFLEPHLMYFEKFLEAQSKKKQTESLFIKKPKNEKEALRDIALAIKDYISQK
jgi:hypothetical protein